MDLEKKKKPFQTNTFYYYSKKICNKKIYLFIFMSIGYRIGFICFEVKKKSFH